MSVNFISAVTKKSNKIMQNDCVLHFLEESGLDIRS